MKTGDLVMFAEPQNEGEKTLVMMVLEDRGDRVLVQSLINMKIQPTHNQLKKDLRIVKEA